MGRVVNGACMLPMELFVPVMDRDSVVVSSRGTWSMKGGAVHEVDEVVSTDRTKAVAATVAPGA